MKDAADELSETSRLLIGESSDEVGFIDAGAKAETKAETKSDDQAEDAQPNSMRVGGNNHTRSHPMHPTGMTQARL